MPLFVRAADAIYDTDEAVHGHALGAAMDDARAAEFWSRLGPFA